MSDSAAHDDEWDADILTGIDGFIDNEYTAPGHTSPIALLPSAGEVALCDHTFELESMRITIDALRSNVEYWKGAAEKCLGLARDLESRLDNLRAERNSARVRVMELLEERG